MSQWYADFQKLEGSRAGTKGAPIWFYGISHQSLEVALADHNLNVYLKKQTESL